MKKTISVFLLFLLMAAALFGCASHLADPPESGTAETGTTKPAATSPPATVPPVTTPPATLTPPPETQETEPRSDLSGEISSDTGTNMNLTAKWYADVNGDGSVSVRIEIWLVSYSITKSEGVCEITLDGLPVSLPTASLELSDNIVDGKLRRNNVLLGSTTYQLAREGTVPFTLVWPFRGWYNNVWVENVTIDAALPLQR